MTRFDPIDREQATGKARELIDELRTRYPGGVRQRGQPEGETFN